MISLTGLAPWGFEFSFPGSLTSTFLDTPTEWPSTENVPWSPVEMSVGEISFDCTEQFLFTIT